MSDKNCSESESSQVDSLLREVVDENDANSNNIQTPKAPEEVIVDDNDDVPDEDLENMSEEEKLKAKEVAEELKNKGNDFFVKQEYDKSIEAYTSALKTCPTSYPNERAILYSNRAAAKIKLDSKMSAIDDCSKAIELNPHYVRALLRRAKLYEDTEKLDESLKDYKDVIDIDSRNIQAQQAISRLTPLIHERDEKLKAEMISKLKDLGNMVLKPFGLSTDNFQMQKDPNTGSYSINFTQNSK